MRNTWMTLVTLCLMLLLTPGCRTPKPVLKPATSAEALNMPPDEKRFNVSTYPKEAFNNRDQIRKLDDQANPITPVRGPTSGMGRPGMPY